MPVTALLLVLAGCGGAPEPVRLTDAHNYAFTGQLDAPSVDVAAHADLLFRWGELSSDLVCQPLDPAADVDNLAVLVFRDLSEAEVEAGLSTGTLPQKDMSAYISRENDGDTEAWLSEFTFFGTDPEILDELAEGSGTWLLLLTTGTEVASGTRTLTFFRPLDASDATTVDLTDRCDLLDLEVDLESLDRPAVATPGPWPLDWSELTTDGQGVAFVATRVDSVMLGFYRGLGASDLEAGFLDLERITPDLWTSGHDGGHTADLSLLVDTRDGSVFPGFDAYASVDGTWVFALRCGSCANPAPLFLTLLDIG